MSIDENAQPLSGLNTQRVAGRTLEELIGICRGIVCDGEIVSAEGRFLLDWMVANQSLATKWPAKAIFDRLGPMLADGTLDLSEQFELSRLIEGLLKGTVEVAEEAAAEAVGTTIPFDSPPPPIFFPGAAFVVTGTFASGTRDQVHKRITRLGGRILPSVQLATRFLVVGSVGSRNWSHATFGNKIEAAVRIKATPRPLSIITEQHFDAQATAAEARMPARG